MAYSKTPEGDTHSVKRIPSVGTPFVMPVNVDGVPTTLNYSNCFPIKEKQFGQEPKFSVIKREPFKAITDQTASTGANISPYFSHWVIPDATLAGSYVYFARNNKFYSLSTSGVGSAPTIADIGTLTNAYLAGVCTAVASNGYTYTVAATGTNVSTWTWGGAAFSTTAITPAISGAAGLVFINGYIFAHVRDSTSLQSLIYNSTAGGFITTWATTDFIAAEMDSDEIISLKKHHNHLVAMGSNSIEFFQDGAVEIGSPLIRVEQYAAKVGVISSAGGGSTGFAEELEDEIYFLGRSESRPVGLFRIKNFRVEEINSEALLKVLGNQTASKYINSFEIFVYNQKPMIVIGIGTNDLVTIINTDLIAYDPDTDAWWTPSLTDTGYIAETHTSGGTRVGNQFYVKGGVWNIGDAFQNTPWHLTCASARTSANILINGPDLLWTTSLTATVYTDIIDMDNDRWKHIYKISAVGDYRTNTLTLSYCNNPTYDSFTAMTPTKVQSTGGARNQLTWTNAGQFRQFSLKLEMAGAYPAKHTGFEISYNLKSQ